MFMPLVPVLIFPGLFFIFLIVVLRLVRPNLNAELTEPHCAKCGYDLRGYAGAPPTVCSECGADLTVNRAVTWGRPRRIMGWRSGLTTFSVMMIPVVVLFIVVLRYKAVRVAVPLAPGPFGRSSLTNQALLASLATTTNQPWDWNELVNRLSVGTLSNAETAKAIDQLIAFIKTQQTPQPLNFAETFVTRADQAGAISTEQYRRLAQAFYRAPQVVISKRSHPGVPIPFAVKNATPWQMPGAELVRALRQVRLGDGTELALRDNSEARVTKTNPDLLSWHGYGQGNAGSLSNDLMPGDYTLIFVVDTGVLLPNTAPSLDRNLPGQAVNWPLGRARWIDEIAVPLTIVPADQPQVELVTDAALDPSTNQALTVKPIRVTRTAAGRRLGVDVTLNGASVPYSFKIYLKLGDTEYSAGNIIANGGAGSARASCDFPTLAPGALSADVIFRADPSYAAGIAGVDRIWSGTVIVPAVRLLRYDLEASVTTAPAP
jgi:hypothetical protein